MGIRFFFFPFFSFYLYIGRGIPRKFSIFALRKRKQRGVNKEYVNFKKKF